MGAPRLADFARRGGFKVFLAIVPLSANQHVYQRVSPLTNWIGDGRCGSVRVHLEEPKVVIEGNLWHCQYEISDDKGKQFELPDSDEFVTPEKRITRIEISADGGKHWTLMSESVGIKVH